MNSESPWSENGIPGGDAMEREPRVLVVVRDIADKSRLEHISTLPGAFGLDEINERIENTRRMLQAAIALAWEEDRDAANKPHFELAPCRIQGQKGGKICESSYAYYYIGEAELVTEAEKDGALADLGDCCREAASDIYTNTDLRRGLELLHAHLGNDYDSEQWSLHRRDEGSNRSFLVVGWCVGRKQVLPPDEEVIPPRIIAPEPVPVHGGRDVIEPVSPPVAPERSSWGCWKGLLLLALILSVIALLAWLLWSIFKREEPETRPDNIVSRIEIQVDKTSVKVPEGGSATFHVKLSRPPPSTATVQVEREAEGDPDIRVTRGNALSFSRSNWDRHQVVQLTAGKDPDSECGTAGLRCTGEDLWPAYLTAIELDNAPTHKGVAIEAHPSEVIVPEGDTRKFYVRLSARPTRTTTVRVTHDNGDPDISVAGKNTLVFTESNWSVDQPITLAAEEDADRAKGTAVIMCSSPELQPALVRAVEDDTQPSGDPSDDPTRDPDPDVWPPPVPPHITRPGEPARVQTDPLDRIAVGEGDTRKLLIRLSAPPDQPVTVAVSKQGGDDDIKVQGDPRRLTFTPENWHTYQPVILEAGQDDDTGNGEATLRCFHPQLGAKTVTAVESDDDRRPSRKVEDIVPPKVLVPPGGRIELRVAAPYQIAGGDEYEIRPDGMSCVWHNRLDKWQGAPEVVVKRPESTASPTLTPRTFDHRGKETPIKVGQ